MRLRLALLPLGLAVGLASEWVAYGRDDLALAVGDFAVGFLLVVCGLVAWERRSESRVGVLMTLAGFAWFVGGLDESLLYLHRGPLVHLHLSYPTGRLPTRLARAVVGVAYVDAAVAPLAGVDAVTVALAVAVALTAEQVFLGTSGPARKAGGPALAAALAFAAALALGAAMRTAGVDADEVVLWTYQIVIASIAVVLLADLLRGRWADAVVTGLVVDLGPPDQTGLLRGRLARALGDPALVVGYRLSESSAFVDDAGRPVELPAPGSGRTVTTIDDRGEPIGVLVHDEALLADAQLLGSVAAAARLAVANARLQAEARSRADELEASRRRIVEAADAQRRRLEEELRLGAEQRLDGVATLLAGAREAAAADNDAIGQLETQLGEARRELREFAQGVHPTALTEGGLMPALALLAEHSPLPVEVNGNVGRLPAPIEAALYFVCSEGLANAVKHAGASRISIGVGAEQGRVVLSVADDGVGGADADAGSGLRGLADRVEALGGRLHLRSAAGAGTRLVAELPTSERASRA